MHKSECLAEKIMENRMTALPGIGHENSARVLVIEDDRSTRRLVSSALRDHCDVAEAADVSQGISTYNMLRPDIVFLDIELPDGNGLDLLSWMLWNDPKAFIVIFSGHYDIDNVVKSIDMGAKGFVSKPFDMKKMMHFVNMCPKAR